MFKRLTLLSLLLLPVWAQAATTEFSLNNGLKVVVREDHRSPVIVTQVWYKVGSSYEQAGYTGLSHALEHMMFKGTYKVPAGEFSRLVAYLGGEDNAFTTDDYTAYYQLYSNNRLPLALELEADRMVNLQLKEEDFKQEIRVVMEERRQRTDDNPQGLALERFQSLAMLTTPSRNPTIGWMNDLNNLSVNDLKQWYQQWYAPNNATLVVVGDVKPEQVKQLAEQYFANIPAQTIRKAPPAKELRHIGERTMTLELPAKVANLYIGFNVPSLTSAEKPKEVYALRMLLGVLDLGLSARLETRLVREQRLLTAVSSGYNPFSRGDTLLTITAIPAEGYSLEQAKAAILDEINKLKTDTISDEELKRVYAAILADDVFGKDSISDQANEIGVLESLDLGWQTADDVPKQLQSITKDDIRQAAQTWLTAPNMTTLFLKPTQLNVGDAQ
ncbi:M16 family metallopeptidase [Agitococcus lubricus]|uniref:Zinc protease n=1 Tax=Agitococcus lubricus TaxID=1077255 RepID=A0A2T5IZG1_9GAMM|nr:pitrilysin family protein [Agitococcus lubricus]PTQ89405.1 zinc protease [Agitococcus lubricus]